MGHFMFHGFGCMTLVTGDKNRAVRITSIHSQTFIFLFVFLIINLQQDQLFTEEQYLWTGSAATSGDEEQVPTAVNGNV